MQEEYIHEEEQDTPQEYNFFDESLLPKMDIDDIVDMSFFP